MTDAEMREPDPGGRPDAVSADLVGAPAPLPVERLYRPADLSAMAFETTADIEPIEGLVGQERAHTAIRFGARIEKPGFNLFVIGPAGARMQQAVKTVLQQEASTKTRPADWVYINNFAEPHKPAVPRCDA